MYMYRHVYIYGQDKTGPSRPVAPPWFKDIGLARGKYVVPSLECVPFTYTKNGHTGHKIER